MVHTSSKLAAVEVVVAPTVLSQVVLVVPVVARQAWLVLLDLVPLLSVVEVA